MIVPERREPIALGALIALWVVAVTPATPAQPDGLNATVRHLEQKLDARIGIAVHDLETDRRWLHRSDERFPMASTFKTLACAALLDRADAGAERLDRIVVFGEDKLVTYSPITEKRTGPPGMSLFELCEATLTTSDNTAANLVLEALGGPESITDFARSLGDEFTRLDRWETELNESTPGDPRDTTTPAAMAASLEKLMVGDALSPESRRQLITWLEGNRVGDALLRAGLPDDWTVADRTGAGGRGTRANTAVLWPPAPLERKPIIAAVYITETEASFAERNAAIAKIGRAIAATTRD